MGTRVFYVDRQVFFERNPFFLTDDSFSDELCFCLMFNCLYRLLPVGECFVYPAVVLFDVLEGETRVVGECLWGRDGWLRSRGRPCGACGGAIGLVLGIYHCREGMRGGKGLMGL